jgi:hypothetical protein
MAAGLARFCGKPARGLATMLGALPALAVRQVSERAQDAISDSRWGVMLAASFFEPIGGFLRAYVNLRIAAA